MPTENIVKTEEVPRKSSMEILSELFGSFDAEPPVIVKKEKSDDRKHKKSKKKHKNKEKKHKKKSKKRKRSDSCSSSEKSTVDVTDLLIKKENDFEGVKVESEQCSSIYDATILAIKEKEMIKTEDDKIERKHRDERHKNKRSRSKSRDNHKRNRSEEKFYESKSSERHRTKGKYEKYSSGSSSRDRLKRDYGKKRFYEEEKHSKSYRSYSEKEKHFRFSENDSSSLSSRIDKKKLLEIARKNAIQMMKSGSLPGALSLGPQAQEKVIAAIKSGGKTVEELTDFCKTLSKKEELGELSSISEDNDSDTDSEKQFHHPFLIKERPVSITMNIKNSVPLPIKNTQERASELRIQFPVSSGQQHRKTESEWVPVSPKKTESTTTPVTTTTAVTTTSIVKVTPPIAIVPPPVVKEVEQSNQPTSSIFPTMVQSEQNIDIAAIVSQRLSAMRKLQENPNDVQALNSMYKAQKEMNCWAESKQQIGQFTGSTGAQILSQAELSSGYQAWARKDQLQTAAPVSGGMGMHLLQKMGWRPGEGLGKEKSGTLEPLLLEVKLDKKGIVAREDHHKRKILKSTQKAPVQALHGKHPVSLLGEYACKNKLGIPQYDLCFECGPDHKKNFLFRVILNNVEYKPQIASPNKKEAKANAALVCLQQLGILPQQPIVQQQPVLQQEPAMQLQSVMQPQLIVQPGIPPQPLIQQTVVQHAVVQEH